MLLLSGTSNPTLSKAVASYLQHSLQSVDVAKFSDGEIRVELNGCVRGKDAFIIQSTCAPANDTLMELILMADALHRAAVSRITAVIPYYGYSRQDRRPGFARTPVSAKVVADMLQTVGINHVVLVDIHAMQIGGFFNIPVDNITATHMFCADVYSKWIEDNPIIVSPDVGGVARARHMAKYLNDIELAIVDKRRPKANVSEVMNIIGDVRDKTCIMVDDMVDTAGTLCKAADALLAHGAKRVVAYCTHPVLSGKALENIKNSGLHELVVSDTIPLKQQFIDSGKVRQVSLSKVLAETIHRIHEHKSVSQILD